MYKHLLTLILTLSLLLSALASVTQSPRAAPDERHHYALTKHVAENFGQFPIHYEEVYTDRPGDYNHLGHPPLYYYAMASVFRLANPVKDFTSVGKKLDEFGAVSSVHVIPMLRAASLFIVALGLLGFYRLLVLMVQDWGLKPWAAVMAALLSCFVPGFIFVGGTLNNDCMVAASWPFILFYFFRYLQHRDGADAWKCTIAVGCGLMSKATLWLMCLSVSILLPLVVVFEMIREARAGRSFFQPAKALFKRHALPWAFLALIVTALCSVHLIGNHLKYGAAQPGYGQIYDIPLEQNKFYKISGDATAVREAPFVATAWEGTVRGMKSLAGVMGHRERFYPRHAEGLVVLTLLASGLIVFVCLPFWWNREEVFSRKFFAFFALSLPLGMLVFFMYRGWLGYRQSGHFGAQGRYAIGYLHLFFVGLCYLLSRVRYRSWIFRGSAGAVAIVALAVLAVVYVDPLMYQRSSAEIFTRSGIRTRIQKHLRAEGFKELQISATSPDPFERVGYVESSRDRLAPYYAMNWDASTLEGPLEPLSPGDTLEVLLWGQGNEVVFANEPVVSVEVAEQGLQGAAAHHHLVGSVELDPSIDIRELSVKITQPLEAPRLFAKLTNHNPQRFLKLNQWWPQWRRPRIFGLYYRIVRGETS